MISFDKKLLDSIVSEKQSNFIHGEERPLLVLVTYWQLTLSVLVGKLWVEAFHFPFRTPLSPSPPPFIAPSTKATLWFDHISNRDLGLGNELKSFVDDMCTALCVRNFFICPRSFINSTDSIERKVLEAFIGLIRRLPLLYDNIERRRRCMQLCSPPFLFGACSCLLPCPFELEVTHGADKLLFSNRKYVLFRV